MKVCKKKGFTLVELLAVIAVLALILIIAVPKITKTIDESKQRTLELTTRSVIKAAEEKYLENTSYGITEEITCESVSSIVNGSYDECEIDFDQDGNASVTIIGKGTYENFICQGTKESVTCEKGLVIPETSTSSFDY